MASSLKCKYLSNYSNYVVHSDVFQCSSQSWTNPLLPCQFNNLYKEVHSKTSNILYFCSWMRIAPHYWFSDEKFINIALNDVDYNCCKSAEKDPTIEFLLFIHPSK